MEALLIASTAMQAIGAIQQGNAAKDAANYNAGMLDQNATVERQQAGAREDALRRRSAMVLGSQRAAFGQSGGGMGGSAADVMQQSAMNAELDALTTRYEGDLRARGMQAQATGERFAGEQAQRQGYFNAVGSILGGAGNYMGYQATQRYRADTLKNQQTSLAKIN
jgi:hypothetical protein